MMTLKLDSIKTLLLSLLYSQNPPDNNSLAALDDEAWATLMGMVGQHRLGPYLYWRLTRELDDRAVPQSVHAQLENQFRHSVLRSLRMQRELVQLHRILDEAGFPYIALKGAYLAFNCYPHAAMRPMRDVDVLVPHDQALDVFKLLLEHGYQQDESYKGNLDTLLQVGKHLPHLISPFGQIIIELHYRLSTPAQQGGNQNLQSTDEGLWSRRISCDLAGSSIPFLSVTDLLLHLCVHAVYDHVLNNGPLTISDLSYLIRKQDIDWQLFWQLADSGGWSKGCLLILKMTEHYDGRLDIRWPGEDIESPTEELLQISCRLALCDFDSSGDANVLGELGNRDLSEKIKLLFRRIFPARRSISHMYPVPQDSFRIFFYYPQNWVRLVRKRGPSLIGSLQNQRSKQEADAVSRLKLWLRNPSS
jgi:hypothetical protein